jgi:hypothetical protein
MTSEHDGPCPLCDWTHDLKTTHWDSLYHHVWLCHLKPDAIDDGMRRCWCGDLVRRLGLKSHSDTHGGMEKHFWECFGGVKE